MVLQLKLRKVGNSVGVVLPKEALTHLHVEEGDSICVTDAADGTLRVSGTSPDFARQMEVAHGVMRRYRNALRELAK
jgi:putative addiction module antidote